MPATEETATIHVSCEGGLLLTVYQESQNNLTLQMGESVGWSPFDENGNFVDEGKIDVTVCYEFSETGFSTTIKEYTASIAFERISGESEKCWI